MPDKEKLFTTLSDLINKMESDDEVISHRTYQSLTRIIMPLASETGCEYETRMLLGIHKVVARLGPCEEYLDYLLEIRDTEARELTKQLFWRYYDMRTARSRRDVKELHRAYRTPDGSVPDWVRQYDVTGVSQSQWLIDDYADSFGPRPVGDGGGV